MKSTYPTSELSFTRVSFKDATFFKLNGKLFSISGNTASKNNTSVFLRMEFDRWADFDMKDFEILGIECLLPEKQAPIEFIGEVSEISSLDHLSAEKLCIKAPSGSFGKRFRCVEIEDEDLGFSIHYNNRRGDPNYEPYYYLKDSYGNIHGHYKTEEEAQEAVQKTKQNG